LQGGDETTKEIIMKSEVEHSNSRFKTTRCNAVLGVTLLKVLKTKRLMKCGKDALIDDVISCSCWQPKPSKEKKTELCGSALQNVLSLKCVSYVRAKDCVLRLTRKGLHIAGLEYPAALSHLGWDEPKMGTLKMIETDMTSTLKITRKIIAALQKNGVGKDGGWKTAIKIARDPIIKKYLNGNQTIMAAYRCFQFDFFTGKNLGWEITWISIYSARLEERYEERFPCGWYPKAFDLEAFKAVASSSGLQIPLGEDH
jgi:hypothetical protein